MKRFFIFFTFVLSFSLKLWAASGQDQYTFIINMEDRVKRDVEFLVQKYDKDALVTAKITPKKVKTELVGTSLTFNSLIIDQKGASDWIEKIDILVLSFSPNFPTKEFQSIINKSLAKSYETKIQLQVQALPQTIKQVEAENPQDNTLEEEESVEAENVENVDEIKKEEKKDPIELSFPKGSMELTLPKGLEGALEQGISALSNNFLKYLWIVLGALLAAAALFLLFSFFAGRRQQRFLNSTLQDGFKNMSSALENMNVGTEKEQDQKQRDLGATSGEDEILDAFKEESLVAVLCDCYWGEFDNYAAYIWSKIPVEKREHLLTTTKFLRDYVDFVSELAPENLNFHQGPYYMNPYSLENIDNQSLSELVRRFPALYLKLPKTRSEKLKISVKERILFMKPENESLPQAEDFNSMLPSLPRTITKKLSLSIQTLDEERELISLDLITLEHKKQIKTLAWLSQLPDENLESILQPFSAMDIANAWVGPEEVLDKIKARIPEKKWELVESYKKKAKASRFSRSFTRLHQKSIEFLVEQEKVKMSETQVISEGTSEKENVTTLRAGQNAQGQITEEASDERKAA